MSLYELINTIKEKIDPNSVATINDLYSVPSDPDSISIANLEKQAKFYDNKIISATIEIQKLEASINTIQKSMATTPNPSVKYTALQQQALPILRKKAILVNDMKGYSQRKANFDVLATNLRQAKREKEESEILKEANIRMEINQRTIEPDNLKDTFIQSRNLNRGNEKISRIMGSSITLEDYNANDNDLLAELGNFDTLDLNEHNGYQQYNVQSPNISSPVYQEEEEQQLQQQERQRRRINNNNNNNNIVGNM